MTLPVKGGKVSSLFLGDGVGDGYFVSGFMELWDKEYENFLLNGGQAKSFSGTVQGDE